LTLTDKGALDSTVPSRYPPREDIAMVQGIDDPGVATFDDLNPFDTVSQATPAADLPFTVSWPMPGDLPAGEYVLLVEVAKEFDHNATYSATARPSPEGIPWAQYGLPYRGQPSVVYRLPVTVGSSTATASTMTYAGYGDPDGMDGNLRTPDLSITSDVPGSGAGRLLVRTDGSAMFRLRATARPEDDSIAPGAATELTAADAQPTAVTMSFVAPGDDGGANPVAGYEVRYRAIEPIDDSNFATSSPITASIDVDPRPGAAVRSRPRPRPRTTSRCGPTTMPQPGRSRSRTSHARAPGRRGRRLLVATAAYGTLLANEVSHLRQFRDGVLRRSVLGELFVET
jgi:hypothetical protein